jgi:hypothetical protein
MKKSLGSFVLILSQKKQKQKERNLLWMCVEVVDG